MDPKILREAALAYQAVYDEELRQEIEEQQDFENWVNSLVEEGYDLSEYTWEEMYETYVTEIAVPPKDPAAARAQSAAAAQGFRNIGNAVRTVANPMGAIVRGMQDATTRYRAAGPRDVKGRPLNQKPAVAKPTPSSTPSKFAGYRDAAFAKARNIQGSPVVGSKPSGGSSTPAARPASTAAARPAASAPTAKPASTAAAKPATPSPTAAAKPAPTTTSKPITSQPPESKSQASAGEIRGMIGRSMERQAASTPTAAAKPTPTPQKRPGGSVKPGSLVSGFDMFDVVKGYLIDEGFAETEQAAIAIMANMSEEWKLEIISEMSPTMQKLTSRPSVNIGGGGSSGPQKPSTTSSAVRKPTTQSNSGLTPMQRLQRPASATIQ